MKMPSNEVSVILTQTFDVPAPDNPIKGKYPWGVGKAYRRSRREYAKQMRKWHRGPKTYVNRIYVPVAQVEMLLDRNAEPDEPQKISDSVTATFTIKPTIESRGLFYGN